MARHHPLEIRKAQSARGAGGRVIPSCNYTGRFLGTIYVNSSQSETWM